MDANLSVLTALGWPLVTLAITLIFRNDIKRALGRLGGFKYRNFEVTFQDHLCQAEELARKLPPPAASDSTILEIDPARPQPFVRNLSSLSARSDERQTLVKLAGRAPAKAIEAAWKLVERSLSRAENHPLPETEAKLAGLLHQLQERTIRGDGQEPSADESRRFVELAYPLATRIEGRI